MFAINPIIQLPQLTLPLLCLIEAEDGSIAVFRNVRKSLKFDME